MGYMRHRTASFAPIATKKARILILGSMPGIKSLEMRQYYAHPQNAFWHVMAALFDAPVDTYALRIALIKNNHLALWDVLKCCERHGSLDIKIDDATIDVNDFAAFFNIHRRITHVFFNGTKSEKEFRKRVLPFLSQKVCGRLVLNRLPSTSSAMASLTRAGKIRSWQAVTRALKESLTAVLSLHGHSGPSPGTSRGRFHA
jgi:TDG/mug DNA glycosylase family protein